MARRKRVDVPTADALREVEEGFEVKSMPPRAAPIAQIAADAAAFAQPDSAEDRAEAAKNSADAARLRAAEADGRLIIDIPADQIQDDALTRDRAVIDAEAMDELKTSIAASGQRIPVDVFAQADGTYGLVSGYRRLMAIRALHGSGGMVRAIVRPATAMSDTYVAMVEENEIRANLSHYERGRIAVLATGQGAFPNIAKAVNSLFASGSKAKRSKIRSFASVHEELGDLLSFPEQIGERLGLRISNALKAGQGAALRAALDGKASGTAAAESRLLADALDDLEGREKVSRAKPFVVVGEPYDLANGVVMTQEQDKRGHMIRLSGTHVDEEFVQTVLQTVHAMLCER
ncbi:MAG: ParB N-terminal domain-containing protein [Pseudomonadota bacterium]